MARKSVGPWFWQAKGGWFVWHEGKRFNLKVRGAENEAAATKAWHRLMAGDDPPTPKSEPPKASDNGLALPEPKTEASTVKELADTFLAAKKGIIKSETHVVYSCLMKRFTDAFGTLKAEGLKATDVSRWLSALPVGVNTRCDTGVLVASCFKWAESEGVIVGNQMKGLKRPSRKSRGAKAVVSPETHTGVLEAATDELKLLLTLLHETGARPSELARLKATDIDFANGVAVLTEHKTAHHTGRPRLVVLTPKAVELLKLQAVEYPEGVLLRNARGNAWTKDAIGHAMQKGVQGSGRCGHQAYGYRHAFATASGFFQRRSRRNGCGSTRPCGNDDASQALLALDAPNPNHAGGAGESAVDWFAILMFADPGGLSRPGFSVYNREQFYGVGWHSRELRERSDEQEQAKSREGGYFRSCRNRSSHRVRLPAHPPISPGRT